jgi:DNA-binding IclR family transcriptional regulator
MLNCLEQRGYLYRSRPGDLYVLSMKTFEIAHRHAPLRGLLEIALPEMQRLADETQQSCNLGTQSGGRVLVIAQVESPGPFGFTVRPGGLFPMVPNSAGRVLLAYQPEEVQRSWLAAANGASGTAKKGAFFDILASIKRQGYAEVRDETFNGITISFPIIGSYGNALAALTVPYISSISFGTRPVSEIRSSLKAAAESISSRLSGSDIRFDSDTPRRR